VINGICITVAKNGKISSRPIVLTKVNSGATMIMLIMEFLTPLIGLKIGDAPESSDWVPNYLGTNSI